VDGGTPGEGTPGEYRGMLLLDETTI
jgi:hypothetical protein